ncbi:MAG: hypothetical protein ABGW74_09590 [Campylobacterales bacterium]
MEISSNIISMNTNVNTKKEIKSSFTEKISADEVKDIKNQMEEQSKEVLLQSISLQSDLSIIIGGDEDKFQQDYEEFQNFLKDIGYDGKPIAELSQDEAKELVSDDGFFGVDQTAKRMSDFIINGANGDEDMLKAGREGMLKGYEDAKEAWGSELPEISQETMKKALETVDKYMAEQGFSVLNVEA